MMVDNFDYTIDLEKVRSGEETRHVLVIKNIPTGQISTSTNNLQIHAREDVGNSADACAQQMQLPVFANRLQNQLQSWVWLCFNDRS